MPTPTLSIERRADGVFSAIEQQALVGFLGGYSGLTRDAYAEPNRRCRRRQHSRRSGKPLVFRHCGSDVQTSPQRPCRHARRGTPYSALDNPIKAHL